MVEILVGFVVGFVCAKVGTKEVLSRVKAFFTK